MKKLLIIGKNGMAGSTIFDYLLSLDKYIIYTTSREDNTDYNIDIEKDLSLLDNIILGKDFDIIINCIGLLVKPCEDNPAKAIYINSYFPHYLEQITKNTNIKIIHLSTDCVFSGIKGDYLDTDILDGEDYYAKSKALGELNNNKDLTIRMSIIGKELKSNGSGLFEWFLAQTGTIKGYKNVLWNGGTTLWLAQNIDKMIDFKVTGLYQLAPDYFINKFQLLKTIQQVWDKKDVNIESNSEIIQNKTLINSVRPNFKPINSKNYINMLLEYKNFIENGS